MLMERLLIRPIITAPEFTVVIATFAIGLMIKCAIRCAIGDNLFTLDGPFGMEPLRARGLRLNPT